MKPKMHYVVAGTKTGRSLAQGKGALNVGDYTSQNSEEIKTHNAAIEEKRRLKMEKKHGKKV